MTSLDALDRWIGEARAGGVLAVDTETDALDLMTSALVGICLATAPGRAYVLVGHRSGDGMFDETPPQLALADVVARLGSLFTDPAVLKIGHNIKYDINVLARHGLAPTPCDDTMVMGFNLESIA